MVQVLVQFGQIRGFGELLLVFAVLNPDSAALVDHVDADDSDHCADPGHRSWEIVKACEVAEHLSDEGLDQVGICSYNRGVEEKAENVSSGATQGS